MSQSPSTAVLGERYRLLERIAAGGMGTVWRAEDTVLHRPVAVKMLNEGLSADQRFVERLRGEAKAAAGLVHPNVAGVYDYGEDGGRPYIVMELIEGETLAARLRRSGPLEPEEVARIGAGVADGLAAAHEAGFVHRDVKPANVMITSRDDVKIMDFGIAAPSSGTGLTGTGMVMGTDRCLAKEPADRPSSAGELAAALRREGPLPVGLEERDGESVAEPAGSADERTAELTAGPATALLPPAEGGATTRPPTRTRRRGVVATPSRAARGPRAARDPRRRRRALWLALALAAVALIVVLAVTLGGSDTVKLPSFAGKTKDQAAFAAKRLGVALQFVKRPSHAPENSIFRQIPRRGTEVATGSTVILLVSGGSGAVTQPEPATPPPPPKDHGGKDKEKPKPDHGKDKGKH